MNTRGQYGNNNPQGRVQVGAFLVHTLEMRQRYNNAKTVAVQALLNDLSREGVATSVGTNRWEIALKEGTWVILAWHPDSNALEVTITDRELRPVDQLASTRRRYAALLDRITPRLKTFGATTVGAAIVGQTPAPAQAPRFAARTRAVRAVFDMYTHTRMPYYLYAEVNGIVDKRAAASIDEANALFAALERSPGEVYVAIFDPMDPLWPGPAYDIYHATPQVPQDRPIVGRGPYGLPYVGLTLYHSVGDRADAVKQMDVDWGALYQSLATEVGEIPRDPSQVDWSKRPPAVQQIREEEVAAWKAIDALPDAQKPAAIKRAQELTQRRGQLYLASFDPKKVAWWKSYASPIFAQWTKFKHEQIGGDRTVADDYISFAERFQTNWDVYENWKKRLDTLRAEALKMGFQVDAPKPTALPTTVWADVADVVESGVSKVASGFGDAWTLVKYGLWGVLGIGAVVALSSVASNLRSGKDPGEKYMELIRTTRARTPRALSGRTQLALPAGEPA